MIRLLWFALLPALLHAEFLAGIARIEITPPSGVAMAGYAARKGVATGVHDPLYASALVLQNGEVSVAYIFLDLIGMNAPAVEQEVAKRFGIPNTVLVSIHTHSGPDRSAADWWKDAQTKIVTVVGRARANLRPARIGAATGQAPLGYNRRQVLPDGQVKMLWSNPQKLPTDPLDNTVSVLRIDDPSGNPRAILVNYAVHPVTLGAGNLQISADYPGVMRQELEKQFPGTTAFFAMGGAGDINPFRAGDPDAFAATEEAGKALAAVVQAIARGIKTEAPVKLDFAAKVHGFDHRTDVTRKVPVAMSVAVIHPGICIVGIGGEVFVEHQIRLRESSDCNNTFFFGQASTLGAPLAGYIPTIRAAAEGGYGADTGTQVEPGAGEILIDRAIVQIHKFTGRLKPIPDLRY